MDNNELREIFIKKLRENKFFIYGAGIVGRRLYEVVKQICLKDQIEGFIISKKKENDPEYIETKKVFLIDEIENKKVNILIAVSDAFENEILHLLHNKQFENVEKAYLYSLINEKQIPAYLPDEVPDKIEIDIRELLSMQFFNGDFIKYDLIKRLLFSEENAIGISDEGIVLVDDKLIICSGEEKIIRDLLNQKKTIFIKQQFDKIGIKYDRSWLVNNATELQTVAIEDYLLKNQKEWFQPLVGIIWPPAYKYADEILTDVKNGANLVKYRDIIVPLNKIEKFIEDIYKTDDVEYWHINEKFRRIKDEKEMKIRVVWFFFKTPKFRIKRFGHTISETGVRFKLDIRNKYKDKIDNYIHDIIMHTTDNYEQSKRVTDKIRNYIDA